MRGLIIEFWVKLSRLISNLTLNKNKIIICLITFYLFEDSKINMIKLNNNFYDLFIYIFKYKYNQLNILH